MGRPLIRDVLFGTPATTHGAPVLTRTSEENPDKMSQMSGHHVLYSSRKQSFSSETQPPHEILIIYGGRSHRGNEHRLTVSVGMLANTKRRERWLRRRKKSITQRSFARGSCNGILQTRAENTKTLLNPAVSSISTVTLPEAHPLVQTQFASGSLCKVDTKQIVR